MAHRIKRPNREADEVDLKSFMTLMVVLIPMLLVSAEFAKVSVYEIRLPEERGCVLHHEHSDEPPEEKGYRLFLTAIITDSALTLGAKGSFLPSLSYREFHRYLTKDGLDTIMEYTPGKQPVNPKTGKEFTVHERFEIYLYTTDENRNVINAMYTKFGEMLTNAYGRPVESVNAGDTVFALGNPRRQIIVSNPSEFESKPLSAYDELKNLLMQVKERYSDADDAYSIIIAAENDVLYDKILQIMDVSRAADFPNISIAKLRS